MRRSLALLVVAIPSLAYAEDQTPAAEPAAAEPAAAEPAATPPAAEPAVPAEPEPAPPPASTPPPSRAEAVSVSAAGATWRDTGSVRERVSGWMLLPKGSFELGGQFVFVTADYFGADQTLEFTDVGLLRLESRYSFGKVELSGGVELLPKQPSFTDELVIQGGGLGARIAAGKRHAIAINTAAGPMMEDLGFWSASAVALQAKRIVHQTLVFTGGLGASYTRLQFDDDNAVDLDPFWFSELTLGGETRLVTPGNEFGFWVGAALAWPIVHADDPFWDPTTRLDFHVGASFSFVKGWDLFFEYSIIDRGDFEEDPTTVLPILDGGFDQQHTIFGITHRWDPKPPKPSYAYEM